MKDFDKEREATDARRDLSFTVGGVTFVAKKATVPEAMKAFSTEPEAGEARKNILDVYDEWVISMLEDPAQEKEWRRVRKEADPPLTMHVIEEVVFWLVEVAAGRPTGRPSSSGRGRDQSTATSKASSSLQTTTA